MKSILKLIVLVLLTVQAWAIPFLQKTASGANSAVASIPCAFSGNVNATEIIAVYVFWNDTGGATLSSLTKSSGGATVGTFTTIDSTVTGNDHIVASSAAVTAPGTATITATFSGTISGGAFIACHDVSGLTGTVDAHVINTQAAPGTGTDAVTSTAVTAPGGDYVFGYTVDTGFNSSSIAAGTGFTLRVNNTSEVTEDLIQSTTSSRAATFTDVGGGADTYVTGVVVFQAQTTPGYVQGTQCNALTTSCTTAAITVTAGDTVFGCGLYQGTGATFSISDSVDGALPNSDTVIAVSTSNHMQCWWKFNSAGGSMTFTCTNSLANKVGCSIMELFGINTLDNTTAARGASNATASTTMGPSASVSTSHANTIYVGCVGAAAATTLNTVSSSAGTFSILGSTFVSSGNYSGECAFAEFSSNQTGINITFTAGTARAWALQLDPFYQNVAVNANMPPVVY